MRILFAATEFAPLVQIGGLGDAVSGLAAALRARGHEVSVVLPASRDLLRHPECPVLEAAGSFRIAGPRELDGRWLRGALPTGVGLRLLELPELYDRPGIYGDASADPEEEALRFIALSRGAAELAARDLPDVLVAHDWHAALAICALRTLFDAGASRCVGTLQVVHNGAYQGRFPASAMRWTGLPEELFGIEGLEFFGDLCLLKGGLLFADRIVAVSPRYAEELTTPDFGGGLEGVYRARRDRLLGIVNGIDTSRFDPASDPALPARFSADAPGGKERCRTALLRTLGLETPPPGRFLAAIGRFWSQKGWDVLGEAVDGLVAGGASLALLGDGDAALAASLRRTADRHPGRVRLRVGWDETLARRIYAASDCVLVPSRFEPCGLVQRLAQRYGSLPIAHQVGGLVDTIEDGETGVLFRPLSSQALVGAVDRAAALIERRGDPLQRALLALDVSWEGPARRWEAILEEATREGRARRQALPL